MDTPKGAKRKRKRGRPSLGPTVAVRLYLRPDSARSFRDLARVRRVPVTLLGQVAIDRYLSAVADGTDLEERGPGPLKTLADASARREIERRSMGARA